MLTLAVFAFGVVTGCGVGAVIVASLEREEQYVKESYENGFTDGMRWARFVADDVSAKRE